ncbi:MAG: UDP-glucose 4-epimerase GalE [Gammaproteobacteria bacterium]|nr:UDP-glucose 4-epimerase GalE [Gammaproteobacteria bacterium]
MAQKAGILVTGGAGYIGSHVVKLLGEAGERVITLDNLSTGFKSAVLYGDFVEGNTGDTELVNQVLRDYQIESVLHFAASTIVPQSVADPLSYYANNTSNTRNLLACCHAGNVKHFIFSSTAAVYGIPKEGICRVTDPLAPINPYGTSKLMSEWVLRDLAAVTALRYVVLRYFNVAGSDPDGQIGQSTRNATLLTKVACEVAVGKREQLFIYGTDYATADGTGVRDYIHVSDLAAAHIDALHYLRNGGVSETLNCGYGHGYSVREVLEAVNRVNGKAIKVKEEARRAGDPPTLIADATRIREVLGWQAQFDNLDFIVETSLAWERKLKADLE